MVRANDPATRAFLLVLLLCAAANALSYFVRSDGWGNLLGQTPQNSQAIGFPWLIWQEGGALGTYNRLALIADLLAAFLTASLAWMVAGWLTKRRLALPSDDSGHDPDEVCPGRALQFQIRTLLALVVIEAVVLGAIRTYGDARPALLATIYVFGPSLLLAVAWRLRDIVPAHRNLALVVTGLLFVPAAAILGESIEGIRDFTRGLLGLFVCWVPQCVFLAVLLVAFGSRSVLLRSRQRN